MDETKSCERLVKALLIIGGVCAIVVPTSINIAMLFGILILYDGIKTDLDRYGAAIEAVGEAIEENGTALEALREETRSGFHELGEDFDALSADIDEVNLDVVQIKGSVENSERGLPDVESTDDRFDDRELASAE